MIATIARNLLIATVAIASYSSHDGTATIAPPTKATLAAPIYVAGFTIRTTNAAEATGQGEIPKLWQRFFQQNLVEQIPHKTGQTLMVVYSDYASDEHGEYTYLLGAPVDSIEGLPKDMAYRKIPVGPYAVVTSPKGPPQETIPATWKHIYEIPESELGGKRSFQTDYEVYDLSGGDPGNMQVEIHLGITPAAKAK